MTVWELTWDRYDPDEEGQREALCTLANGRFGTRGAAPECAADGTHYPGTYVAGLFNRLSTDVEGRQIENEDMVNVPNWLPLTFRIDGGPWFCVDDVELLDYRQTLELRRGVLLRALRFRDGEGRTTSVTQRRIVHLAHAHLAALETSIRAEDWSGTLTVRSGIDGTVRNTGVERYAALANRHLEVLHAGADGEVVALRARTVQSRVEVAVSARTRAWLDDERIATATVDTVDAEAVAQELAIEVRRGSTARIEKVVSLRTSRDAAISEPWAAATGDLEHAPDTEELIGSHVFEWDDLWRRFTIDLEGVPRARLAFNVHLFHLIQVASPLTVDLDVGIPARGLHGEAYRGHLFWDELFIFPLLNYRVPAIARRLLRYRYRRLPAARRAATAEGLAGAMFPWQSGSDGREESQVLHLNPESGRWIPDDSHRQRHIGSAIAYNVWQFFQVTRDVDFLADTGAEIVIEVARFWASMASFDRVDDRYDIHHVVGPDEFHDHDPNWPGPGLRNNAYTNVMAAWVLAEAPDLLDALPEPQRTGLTDRLGLGRDELELWEDVSRKLRVPFHDGDVISQFEGYEALEELDWDGYRERYGDIHRLDRILEAEGDDVIRYKASKQADALMLLYLFSEEQLAALFARLGYRFDDDLVQRNVDYYRERTSDGSTLSAVVHSWVLATADRRGSRALFEHALEADLSDVQGGTTAEGIHLGAMAGTVDIVQRGYSGMEVAGDLLRFRPRLPAGIDRVTFTIYYRQRWLEVTLSDGSLTVASELTDLPPVRIGYHDDVVDLEPGQTRSFP